MKIAILTANLGNFDKVVGHAMQDLPDGMPPVTSMHFNDNNFPPVTGLSSRLQYRIPKMFGWQMFKGFDIYIWLDGSMSLQHTRSVRWFLEQLGDADMAFFVHPWRKTVKQEVDHIEEYLQKGNKYITSRYKNGLHKEFYREFIEGNKDYVDDILYASTAFIYRNNEASVKALSAWWALQSRYFTCDQVQLSYALHVSGAKVNRIKENLFKSEYISLTSKHK